MADAATTPIGWERALMAAERVKERLRRAVTALENAAVPYAVAGGNAVAEWVARVDEGAVRNTRDVDLLVRRADLHTVQAALQADGLDCRMEPNARALADRSLRDPAETVHVLIAGERLHPSDERALPDFDETERGKEFQVLSLVALTRMKLAAHRIIDRVHLCDMIGVGLLDATWPARFPPPLGERLQQLLDDPEG